MIFRTLSPSKIKHLLPVCFSSSSYTYTKPVSNILLQPQPNPFCLNPAKTLVPPSCTIIPRPFSSQPGSPFPHQPNFRDGNYDESTSQSIHICPGCGVRMQGSDPKKPGFYVTPSVKDPNYKTPIDKRPIAEESEISASIKKGFVELENPESSLQNSALDLPKKPVVCSRCHSLRYYGKVKDSSVENLLPDFDFDHTVGRRLSSASGPRTVVLMVVDAADFDGSFPRTVARLVSNTIDENYRAWKEGKAGNVPRVLLVVTKIDLLPTSVSPTGLEQWVRTRAREGGATKLTSVHLVSAKRGWGLKNLADDVVGLAGARGHVWAVGAQNAGKSTLINAIGKGVGGTVTHLTEAPVPGTTLGILRVEGVLPRQARLFDTPGLLHPHQITTRLTKEEQKLVHISKELKPRTYRIKAGYSVHIAGLMRLDIQEASVDSIYVTVWASPYLPLHMGKTENVLTMLEDHFGRQLKPPNGESRVEELGNWVKKEFRVSGNSWNSSSVDIAGAGLGWFAIGLKGEALLDVWTYEGVNVISRNSLISERAKYFEVAGFTVSEIVSTADRALNKPSKTVKSEKMSNLTMANAAVSSQVDNQGKKEREGKGLSHFKKVLETA